MGRASFRISWKTPIASRRVSATPARASSAIGSRKNVSHDTAVSIDTIIT